MNGTKKKLLKYNSKAKLTLMIDSKLKELNYYRVSDYQNQKTDLLIATKFGFCYMNIDSILDGQEARVQTAVSKTRFLRRFIRYKLGNKYDLSSVYWIDSTHKIALGTKYGKVLVNYSAIKSGNKPNKCSAVNKSEYLKNMLIELYPNNKYDFSKVKYSPLSGKILIGTDYGDCEVSMNGLLKGKKPTIQSAINKYEYMLKYCRKIHNYKYSYPPQTIKNTQQKIKCVCNIHGEFTTHLAQHMQEDGNGCPKCGKICTSYKTELGRNHTGKQIVYILECWNDEEYFFKLGFTQHSVKKRYSNNPVFTDNYNYNIIASLEVENGAKFEAEFHDIARQAMSYYPKHKFAGHTEAYSCNPMDYIKLEDNKLMWK